MGTEARRIPAVTFSSPDAQDSLVTSLNRLSYRRGEERLMLAVLKDAVDCIEQYCYGQKTGSRSDYEAALAWVHIHDV
jgi:SpoU rRNA methylase family enzyme